VIVRSPEEILATLDQNARLEELPFMPQMLKYCGMKLRVRKRAHKLCDTAFATGGRRMADAVILDDIRCDGQDFGGCDHRCTVIWKEAWLKRAGEDQPAVPTKPLGRLETLVRNATRRPSPDPGSGQPLYVCQATQLPAATKLLPRWEPRQYVEDYQSGNATLSEIVSRLLFVIYAELVASGVGLGSALRWLYDAFQKVRGGNPYPIRAGRLPLGGPTPAVTLGLEVGELVRVRSSEEILGTVDELLVNRGMAFHPEMMPYCGKTFRVKQRLRKIINEKTGRLVELKNSCVVLDGPDCHGCYNTRPINCPRACPPYWREIWLERVDSDQSDPSGSREVGQDAG
jgi:hypothetical protein